ncbi:(2Fe-2S)-binding protein [Kitasatospora sp. NPDC048540]|uniref:(2Fe-2S)-binding protein n=1 Tax=Kitasatospora sp. NPDC048540 TaxID=3155634 RepID=UPI00340E0655
MLQLTAGQPCRTDELAETYRLLFAACDGVLRVELARRPMAGGNWRRADTLACAAEEMVAAESARITAEHGRTPREHVAASRALHTYLWAACLLISGPWYLEGRVPRLRAMDLWVDPSDGRLALSPGEWAPGGEAELRTAVAEHLGPVLAAFQPYVRRGPRALWGMAADDLVSGIWYLGRLLGEEDRAVEAAEAVLPGGTPPFPGAAAFRRLTGTAGRTHWTRTRAGCCLYYAIRPDDACVTCPRTTDEERVRRLEA